MKCVHCQRRKARHTWRLTACAAKGRVHTARLCRRCDVLLNELMLDFLRHPNAAKLIEEYRRGTR